MTTMMMKRSWVLIVVMMIACCSFRLVVAAADSDYASVAEEAKAPVVDEEQAAVTTAAAVKTVAAVSDDEQKMTSEPFVVDDNAASTTSNPMDEKYNNNDDGTSTSKAVISNLLNWFLSQDESFLHPRVQLQRRPFSSPYSFKSDGDNDNDNDDKNNNQKAQKQRWGMFATSDIKKGDVLLKIPRSILLSSTPVQVGDNVVSDFDGVSFIAIVTAVHPPTANSSSSSTTATTTTTTTTYDLLFEDGEVYTGVDRSFFTIDGFDCGTVRNLVQQMKHVRQKQKQQQRQQHSSNEVVGASSSRAEYDSNSNNTMMEMEPYIEYLLAQQTTAAVNLPDSWSSMGQSFLLELLGQGDPTLSFQVQHMIALPPFDNTGWIQTDWIDRCRGSPSSAFATPTTASQMNRDEAERDDDDDETETARLEALAYYLVIQRGWDDIMIPLYDMFNHRNGPWLNTDVQAGSVRSEDDSSSSSSTIEVIASRDVVAGEELYTSYNFCKDCAGRYWTYGTPEILRDYGFIEQFPQRWIFHQQRIGFDINVAVDADVSNGGGDSGGEDEGSRTRQKQQQALKLTWIHENSVPNHQGLLWMQSQLVRLRGMEDALFSDTPPDPTIPQTEWDTIREYRQALITALTLGIEHAAKDIASNQVWGNNQDQTCQIHEDSQQTCTNPLLEESNNNNNLYDPLTPTVEVWGDERPQTCEFKEAFHFRDWQTLESVQSHYQRIGFAFNPVDRDICFDLDNTVQICSSYRPHYHEMVVHYTARFLGQADVKRVLFVGGGDSMLLHEVLKYNATLEKVVGLELDQQVTRGAFKWFGTQPHWDNEKVEWWYGDATKSLLMLPRSYFGSFDMVLVDLSETVMALTVTEDLDVMEALALLVKPDGIMVKNEYMYFRDMSAVFEHTLHLHFYDVPVVCSQSIVLGSNKIDFLEQELRDHEVYYLYDLLDEGNAEYRIVRDYQRNETSVQKHCRMSLDEPEKEPINQDKSSGILMIVEAEQANVSFQSSLDLKDSIAIAVEKSGMHVVSALVPPSAQTDGDRFSKVTVVLREGYVVARYWPKRKYVAFDIHLWSLFGKQDEVRKSLLIAVGSDAAGPASSAYRIVAGGVFGASTWKSDEKNRGPHVTELCDRPAGLIRDNAPNQHDIALMIEASTDLIPGDDGIVVVVLCGLEGVLCESLEIISQDERVKNVVPLWSCHDIRSAEEDPDQMIACEKEVISSLKNMSSKIDPIRAMVLDSSAHPSLGRIVINIFSLRLNAMLWLTPDFTVSAILQDKESKPWRRAFIQKFRERIFSVEPVFTSEVIFNSTDSSFELAVTSSGDELFVERMVELGRSIEQKTGLRHDLRSVRGGLFLWMDDFEPSQFFMPGDYDLEPAMEQWKSQQTVGFQTVVQLEAPHNLQSVISSQNVIEALEQALRETGTEVEMEEIVSLEETVGEGSIVIAFWTRGTATALWDGRKHIDVNVFTLDESEDCSTVFVNKMISQVQNDIQIILRDEQPRGTGRVVNILDDEPSKRLLPYWSQDFAAMDVEYHDSEDFGDERLNNLNREEESENYEEEIHAPLGGEAAALGSFS